MTATVAPSTLVPVNPLSLENRTLVNILSVDPDRFVREAVREVATAMGYSATTCESAEQGFQLIDSQAVDVVLMDLEPSDAGWLDVLHDIKHRRSDIEIIVVSGNATVDSPVQAFKNSPHAYIP